MYSNRFSNSSNHLGHSAVRSGASLRAKLTRCETVWALGLVAILIANAGCNRIQSVANAAVSKSSGLATGMTTVSAEELLGELQDSENELNKLYKNVGRCNGEETLGLAVAIIDHVRDTYAKLGQAESVSSDQEQAAQMSSLRSHYLASQMLPDLRDSVVAQADQVIALRPESGDAQIAKVLNICAKLDPCEEVQTETLHTLNTVSRSFDRPRHGVALFSAVAQEYWKNGQPESAEKVLKTGIKTFEDRQEKISLVHQMIDQGHRDPPNAGRICQQAFKRSEAALSSAYASGPTRSVKFRS